MQCLSKSAPNGACRQVDRAGATENTRPDIARLDNAVPYRKGGHRETCFSVRVDAHYKFMFDAGSIISAAHRFYVCSSISFCFTYCYVRQTKLASSLDNVWAHYKIVMSGLAISAPHNTNTDHMKYITNTTETDIRLKVDTAAKTEYTASGNSVPNTSDTVWKLNQPANCVTSVTGHNIP